MTANTKCTTMSSYKETSTMIRHVKQSCDLYSSDGTEECEGGNLFVHWISGVIFVVLLVMHRSETVTNLIELNSCYQWAAFPLPHYRDCYDKSRKWGNLSSRTKLTDLISDYFSTDVRVNSDQMSQERWRCSCSPNAGPGIYWDWCSHDYSIFSIRDL